MESYLSPEMLEKIIEYSVTYGGKALLAIIVLYVGFWIIARIQSLVSKLLSKNKNMDESLRIYASKMLAVLLKLCLLISVASMVGIQTTSFIALLGAAGLAVGMALQGSLSNFAGGVLILLFRPFKVGDYLSAQGEEGSVTAIDIFCTTLKTLDNKRVILPNGPLVAGNIVNVTAEPDRRVDLAIGMSYSDDISKAQKALLDAAAGDSRVYKDPAPFVGVTEYGDNSINLTYRLWCKTEDYWDVYFDFNKKMKEVFDSNNLGIPFPQRDVHLIKE